MSGPGASGAAVRAFGRRLYAVCLARRWVRLSTAWFLAWGSIILVARLALGHAALPPGSAAAGPLLALLLAAALERRRAASPAALRARLDLANGCGGLLMASGETDLGPWAERLTQLHTPRVRWPGRRPLGLCAASLAYAAAATFVPIRRPALAAVQPMNVARAAAEIAARVEALAEVSVLSSNRADELREALAKAAEEARGDNPAATWSLLDHVADKAEAAAAQAAGEAAVKMDLASAAAELAAALAQGQGAAAEAAAGTLATGAVAAAQGALGELLDDPALASLLGTNLAGCASADCAAGTLSPEQLRQLLEALRNGSLRLSDQLKALGELQFIDPSQLQFGECDGGDCSNAVAVALPTAAGSGLPSRGGISRGRGDAAMTWQDEGSSADGAAFTPRVLPSVARPNAADSAATIAITAEAPRVNTDPAAPAPGALAAGEAGAAAHRQPILPRHRGAVQRYFERR